MHRVLSHRDAVYPVLIACYSVLALAAANLHVAGRIEGLFLALCLAVLAGAAAWLVGAVLCSEADRRLITSVVIVVWFVGYDLLTQPVVRAGVASAAALLLSVAALGATMALIRNAGVPPAVARVVRVSVLIVFVFPLFAFAGLLVSSGAAGKGPVASASAGPHAPRGTRPDVFLIILDKYTGSTSLRTHYGYDNSWVEEELGARRFVVPEQARSNYPHTWLSLASMLNWVHIPELLADRSGPPVASLNAAIEDNRTWRFFRDQGYEFVFLPTTFQSTRSNRFADLQLPEVRPTGVNVGAAWRASTALAALPSQSSAGGGRPAQVFPYPIETAEQLEQKFRILADLAGSDKPRFVFAHLLLPHEPYVFNKDCSHRTPYWPPTDYVADQSSIRAAYTDQVQCLNRMLLDLVDALLARSDTPPIILLQSDHGHGMMAVNPLRGDQLPMADLDPHQIQERMDVFAAYYLPDGGESLAYPGMTPVNLIPSVLNYYFRADIPIREDRLFWARLHPPFDLRPLD